MSGYYLDGSFYKKIKNMVFGLGPAHPSDILINKNNGCVENCCLFIYDLPSFKRLEYLNVTY
jgi:hypothetical protein